MWRKLPKDERDRLIAANKSDPKPGIRRDIVKVESVAVVDELSLAKVRKHIQAEINITRVLANLLSYIHAEPSRSLIGGRS